VEASTVDNKIVFCEAIIDEEISAILTADVPENCKNLLAIAVLLTSRILHSLIKSAAKKILLIYKPEPDLRKNELLTL
jgi:hypothetical protein